MVDSDTFAIGELLSDSVISALERFGASSELPALRWRVVRYPEGLVIEGSPRQGRDAGSCPHWADRLGMTSYGFESSLGARSWFLNDDIWSIEIRDSVTPG